MEATIPIPYALGQELWWVGNGYREEWTTCPECLGTRIITMILGSGEQAELQCETCRLGFDDASGKIKRVFYDHRPTRFVPGRVSVDGSDIRYSESGPDSTCYGTAQADDLFSSEAECQVRCDKLNAERTKAEAQRMIAVLSQNRRSMAHSVSYWRQQIAKTEKDLERMRGYLSVATQKEAKKKGGAA